MSSTTSISRWFQTSSYQRRTRASFSSGVVAGQSAVEPDAGVASCASVVVRPALRNAPLTNSRTNITTAARRIGLPPEPATYASWWSLHALRYTGRAHCQERSAIAPWGSVTQPGIKRDGAPRKCWRSVFSDRLTARMEAEIRATQPLARLQHVWRRLHHVTSG